MSLVWDEAGARYYETGVSKGIYFPIDGSLGVPWNGLVSVNLDPSGGEPEHYYFDGIKYMDRVLAEDFQATVSAVNTPREFEAAEGVKNQGNGMKTHFNKRDKFHMAWRTNIGNDESADLGYKIHIAYNCLVQPAGRSYQTIADNPTLDTRSFVITATPACGRDSYFTFDSREGDLSGLEAQLNNGLLPKCWELRGLVTGPDAGDPDAGCPVFEENLEEYNPGQVLGILSGSDPVEHPIYGQVNNGLDVKELFTVYENFYVNDSDVTVTNPEDELEPLSDDSDETYVELSPGNAGWTIGLDQLIGDRAGSKAELHIRMSISGGVSEDDPDNIDADAQVFITTDNVGDNAVGGFSDGKDEGMGFALSDVDGNIVDYVIPLSMDAWINSTYDDALNALKDAAYLCFVGADNNNPGEDDIVVRVYDISVVVLNDTDQDRYLRYNPGIGPAVNAYIEQDVYEHWLTPSTALYEGAYRSDIDFKGFVIPDPGGGADQTFQSVVTWADTDDIETPGILRVEVDDETRLVLTWYDADETVLDTFVMDEDVWYTATVEVTDTTVDMKVFARGRADDLLIDNSQTISGYTATTHVRNNGGVLISDGNDFEVVLDNAFMQYHCNVDGP